MNFSGSMFLFLFIPTVFITILALPQRLKNVAIVLASLFFFAWGAGWFVLALIGTIAVDWLIGFGIDKAKNSRTRKLLLLLDVILNLSLLLWFKYANFFIENANTILSALRLNPIIWTKVVMPLGISFVTFSKMTYCLDIAFGKCVATKNFLHLIEFNLLFPKVIMGPIAQWASMKDQFENRVTTTEDFQVGFQRFAVGLFKKVWIADTIAVYANNIFSMGSAMPFDYAWSGAIIYTLQLFMDFSGYTDMAVGLMKMMGFSVIENFNHPYISSSITEFWKRWHISLTTWLREYLFYPLQYRTARQKPRKGDIKFNSKTRVYNAMGYFNLFLIFFISGFWHGSGWTYILWGVYMGILLCLDKAFILAIMQKIPRICSILLTMLLVILGNVLFRSTNIADALAYFKQMFDFTSYYVHIDMSKVLYINNYGYSMLILAVLISWAPALGGHYEKLKDFVSRKRTLAAAACLALFALATIKVATAQVENFIYFQF
ncbi:MAG: hypothetical protein LBL18_02605 [Bacteroidales bacterium]|jgi:alginate O-acetyltransferase complex protein AlgI|nr:hypothetical protein [Bacteroidales bacterium]